MNQKKENFSKLLLLGALVLVVGLLVLLNPLQQETNSTSKIKLPSAFDKELDFDLNESIKPKNPADCSGFLIGSTDELIEVSLTGATWAHVLPGPFIWENIQPKFNGSLDFTKTDELVLKAQEQNVSLIATIWPFASWDSDCRGTYCIADESDEFYNALPIKRCNPCDYSNYLPFLKALIERYDGDGIADMPDLLRPITHWQLLDEPEKFYKESYLDYLDVLKQSREVIIDECPNCVIVQASASNAGGIESDSLDFWRDFYANAGGDYIDVVAIHSINGDDSLNMNSFSNLLESRGINKPIWITKLEFNDEVDLVLATNNAFELGAQKLFFTNPDEFNGLPTMGNYEWTSIDLFKLCG